MRASPYPCESRGMLERRTRPCRASVADYASAGIQHLLFTPDRGDLESWLAGMAQLARQLDLPS